MLRIGDQVGIIKLKRLYDAHVVRVLGDRLRWVEQKRSEESRRRPSAKYEVIADLPSAEEYQSLKLDLYKTEVESAVDDARSEIESLLDEMRDWYENLPENFQQSERGDNLQEVIDVLEGIEIDSAPDVSCYIAFPYFPSLKIKSRADRRDDASSRLRCAKEAIDEFIYEHTEGDKKPVVAEGEEPSDEDVAILEFEDDVKIKVSWSELRDFAESLETAADSLEEATFPGMFG